MERKKKTGRGRNARMPGAFAVALLLLNHSVQAWPIPDRDLPPRAFDYNQSMRERQYDAQHEAQKETDKSNTPVIGDVTGPATLAVGDRILIKGTNLGRNPIVYLGSVRLPLISDATARPDGTVYTSLPFGLKVNVQPSVTAWSLDAGPAGLILTVHGVNLVGVTGIRIGDLFIPALQIRRLPGMKGPISDDYLEIDLPARRLKGRIQVFTVLGRASSEADLVSSH